MLTLDGTTYSVVCLSLFHDYSYPVKDIKLKTGYSIEDFKFLSEKYNQNHDNYIDGVDLMAVVSGLELMIKELNDNDFLNLIQIDKKPVNRLLTLLKAAKKDQSMTLITSDLWK